MMAFAMACARHDLFPGMGTISAGMPKHFFESCRLAEPMLLVMINGDGETCCRMPAVTSAIPAAFFRTTGGIQETAALFAKADNETAARQPTRTQHVMANMSSNALSG